MTDFKAEELQGYAELNEGTWIAAAFIDRGDVRTVMAVAHGKQRDSTLRRAMKLAIQRINDVEAEPKP